MSLSTDNIQAKHAGDAAVHAQRSARLDYGSVTPLFVACDVSIIFALCVLVNQLTSDNIPFAFEPTDYTRPIGIGILATVAFVLTTISRGLYKPWRMVRIMEQATAAAMNWIFAMLVVAAVIFCLKVGVSTSRLSTGLLGVLGFIALPLSRWAMAVWLRRAMETGAVRGRPAVIVGNPSELEQVVPAHMLVLLGLKEMRRFSLSAPNPEAPGRLGPGDVDVLKSAVQFARQHRIEEIILAMPWSNLDRLEAVRSRLRALPIPVKLLPDAVVSEVLDAPRVDFGSTIAIEVQRAPLSRWELTQKRLLDITVASVALTLLLPLFFVIAAIIKADSRGPVIFRQRRNGFGGREFTIYKFRSMTVMEDGGKVVQAQRNDRRVTRVGRFLRASSLDELPQVLNVLFGHMSIVGPRPHALAHDDAYSKLIAGYAFRHHVKPGITGWAQVMGLRGETAELEQMARRIEMDLWYINNWSIVLDVKIILKTFIEVLRKDAY